VASFSTWLARRASFGHSGFKDSNLLELSLLSPSLSFCAWWAQNSHPLAGVVSARALSGGAVRAPCAQYPGPPTGALGGASVGLANEPPPMPIRAAQSEKSKTNSCERVCLCQ
jgi:hypothetical protein